MWVEGRARGRSRRARCRDRRLFPFLLGMRDVASEDVHLPRAESRRVTRAEMDGTYPFVVPAGNASPHLVCREHRNLLNELEVRGCVGESQSCPQV